MTEHKSLDNPFLNLLRSRIRNFPKVEGGTFLSSYYFDANYPEGRTYFFFCLGAAILMSLFAWGFSIVNDDELNAAHILLYCMAIATWIKVFVRIYLRLTAGLYFKKAYKEFALTLTNDEIESIIYLLEHPEEDSHLMRLTNQQHAIKAEFVEHASKLKETKYQSLPSTLIYLISLYWQGLYTNSLMHHIEKYELAKGRS